MPMRRRRQFESRLVKQGFLDPDNRAAAERKQFMRELAVAFTVVAIAFLLLAFLIWGTR